MNTVSDETLSIAEERLADYRSGITKGVPGDQVIAQAITEALSAARQRALIISGYILEVNADNQLIRTYQDGSSVVIREMPKRDKVKPGTVRARRRHS